MLGLFVVGVTNRLREGVEHKSFSMTVQFVSPRDNCHPLPFIDSRGEGQQGKWEKSYSAWPLGCPLVRRCPSGHIEEEPHYVVVEAAAWPGEVHFGMPGASSE
jgi:hypothetical protein